MVIKDIASVLVRLVVAAILIVGPLGAASFSADDHSGMDRVHHVLSTPDHDCCNPEPASPDWNCATACAQAPCGPIALPVPVGWPANVDRLAIRWPAETALRAGIPPDPAIPPPRA
jgi:hypothetical protein